MTMGCRTLRRTCNVRAKYLLRLPFLGVHRKMTSCLCLQMDTRQLGTAFWARQQGQLLSTYNVNGVE